MYETPTTKTLSRYAKQLGLVGTVQRMDCDKGGRYYLVDGSLVAALGCRAMDARAELTMIWQETIWQEGPRFR